MSLTFNNRVALVTGAARGIGLADVIGALHRTGFAPEADADVVDSGGTRGGGGDQTFNRARTVERLGPLAQYQVPPRVLVRNQRKELTRGRRGLSGWRLGGAPLDLDQRCNIRVPGARRIGLDSAHRITIGSIVGQS